MVMVVGRRGADHVRSGWPRLDVVVIGVVVAAVALLALVPLCFLLWQSVRAGGIGAAAGFTFDHYLRVYGSLETLRTFVTSLQFAAGSAGLAFLVGTAAAWIVERTNTPLRALFPVLVLVPLIVPGILFTIAWIFLASPKIGWINLILRSLLGTADTYVDAYTLPGMIWVEGLHYSPMAFALMSAAFKAMDPSLEEAAMMGGAGALRTTWRITLRLARPAIVATLLILFLRAVESFEVPALLGLPVGIQVFSASIYQAINQFPSQVGTASTYSVTLLLIASLGLWLQSRATGSARRYATVTGKAFRPRPLDLGGWRFVTLAFLILYTLLIVALPLLVLVWASFQNYYAIPSLAGLRNLTLDPYRFILAYPGLGDAVLNSLFLAVASATIVMLLTAVVCWIVVKTKMPGRWLLDNLASLPMVFPGVVLGLSLMMLFLNVDVGIYGTIWILLIAYVARFMPYGLRYNTVSMIQIHKELEDSAAMCGASWIDSFRRIVLPLLKPGFVAGWIYIMIVSVRELSSSILLYSRGTEVVSIVVWELWENGQFVELSALSVLFILGLVGLVAVASLIGRRFGIKEV